MPKLQKMGGQPAVCYIAGRGRPATSGRLSAVYRCLKLLSPKILLLPPAHIFLHMYSTLTSWLQHMSALPTLLLKFSNIYNF
jgi:hypothetical protein